MPSPAIVPSNTAQELFPDSFGAKVINLIPFDPTQRARAFDPYPLTLSVRSPHDVVGLIPPLEVIVASPSGLHERQELTEIPIAISVIPSEGGRHRVTVREVAHNRWYGATVIDAEGERTR